MSVNSDDPSRLTCSKKRFFKTSKAHSGEVKCRLEPMSAMASQTAVTVSTQGGVRRITRIEIQGENVANVL